MSGLSTSLLVFLFLVHGGGCSDEVKEGEDKDITCKPASSGQTVWWFRIKDNAEMEFIASFLGKTIKSGVMDTKFSDEKIEKNILTLKNFRKITDSGSYSCAAIISNKLQFGPVTSLRGPPEPKKETKQIPITRMKPENITVRTTPFCENKGKNLDTAMYLDCNLVILIPLAAGSGLLLILLIITILYCNRIRTRRCPHHYKRQPRNRPPGHRPLPNHPEF